MKLAIFGGTGTVGGALVSQALGPWNTVTTSDVADFMLRCLDDAATVGTAPMIAAGPRRSTRRIAGITVAP